MPGCFDTARSSDRPQELHTPAAGSPRAPHRRPKLSEDVLAQQDGVLAYGAATGTLLGFVSATPSEHTHLAVNAGFAGNSRTYPAGVLANAEVPYFNKIRAVLRPAESACQGFVAPHVEGR